MKIVEILDLNNQQLGTRHIINNNKILEGELKSAYYGEWKFSLKILSIMNIDVLIVNRVDVN